MSRYSYVNPLTKRIISISAIEKYSKKSFEEMRYEYYLESITGVNTQMKEFNPLSMLQDKESVSKIKDLSYEENRRNNSNDVPEPMDIKIKNDVNSNEKFVPFTSIGQSVNVNGKQHPKNKNLSLLIDHDSNKRAYYSETEDPRAFKKMRIEENESDSTDDEKVINNKLKRDISFSENYDLLAETIGKKVKVESRILENVSNIRKNRRKNNRLNNLNCVAEDTRVLNLIDEHRKQGNIFAKAKKFDNAIESYTAAIVCSSRHLKMGSICYSNRALCLQKLGRISEALNDCAKAVELDDRNWKAYLRKIKCLIDLNRYAEAEKDALAFNNMWKIDEGRQLLEVIKSALKLSKLKENAEKFADAEDFSEALKCYNEAIEIDCGDSILLGKRASVLFLMSRYNESLADLDDALALTPGNEIICRTRIECLVKLERFHEATKYSRDLYDRISSKENEKLLSWSINMEKQANNRNYYQILGVPSSATVAEIKKRYRKLSLLYHPDKLINCDKDAKSIQEEKFKQLTKIHTILSDPVSRRMYDVELRCRY